MSATALAVNVPSITEFASEQRKAEELAVALKGYAIASADEYTLADDMLSEVARREAGVLDIRKSWTGPIYEGLRKIESDFRPWLSALTSCKGDLKRAMGAYRVALEAREREARELAAKAAESDDADGLVEALTVANAAAAKPESRATTRFMWRVKECNPPAMSREFLVPDLPRLETLARTHKGDEPPIVPGVTFERVAQIGAKK